jgi:elongation factor 1-gamma
LLLGSNDREYATILQYMSFFNSEIVVPLVERYLPLAGIRPYDASTVATFERMSEAAVAVVETELEGQTFLVGKSISLADYFCAGIISLGFDFFYDKKWRESHPNVVRWYASVVELEPYKAVTGKVEWLEEPKFGGRTMEQEK